MSQCRHSSLKNDESPGLREGAFDPPRKPDLAINQKSVENSEHLRGRDQCTTKTGRDRRGMPKTQVPQVKLRRDKARSVVVAEPDVWLPAELDLEPEQCWCLRCGDELHGAATCIGVDHKPYDERVVDAPGECTIPQLAGDLR